MNQRLIAAMIAYAVLLAVAISTLHGVILKGIILLLALLVVKNPDCMESRLVKPN